jgi:hypothetical protein
MPHPPPDRRPRAIPRPLVLAAAAALLTAGCGGETVRVSGRLVKDGEPYTARLTGREPETFAVDFVGTVGGAKVIFPATLTADGTFRVGGPDGRGIPRGRYRITVLHSGFLGAGGDRLQGRFAAATTPLTADLNESASLTIDIGTGTVAK